MEVRSASNPPKKAWHVALRGAVSEDLMRSVRSLLPLSIVAACSACLFPIDVGNFSASGALEGDPCSEEQACSEGLVCDDGTCVAIPPEREPCDENGACPEGLFCDRDGLCSEEV